MADIRERISFLQDDLNEAIKLGAWGGAATYVEIYNNLLEEAKKANPNIPLKAPEPPRNHIAGVQNVSSSLYQTQEGAEKQTLLALKPLMTQLRLFVG